MDEQAAKEHLRELGNRKCEACGNQQYAKLNRGEYSTNVWAYWFCVNCNGKGANCWIAKPGTGKRSRPKRHASLARKSGVTHCMICLRSRDELGEDLDGHHVVEYSDGEPCSEPFNTMIVCKACHSSINWIRRYVGHNQPDGDLLEELRRWRA